MSDTMESLEDWASEFRFKRSCKNIKPRVFRLSYELVVDISQMKDSNWRPLHGLITGYIAQATDQTRAVTTGEQAVRGIYLRKFLSEFGGTVPVHEDGGSE